MASRSPRRGQGVLRGDPAFDRPAEGFLAHRCGRRASGGQGGEPHHHRLHTRRAASWASRICWSRRRPRRPTTPPAEPPSPASPAARGWCSPAPRRRPTSTNGSAWRWTCPIAGAERPRWCSPRPGVLTGAGTADQEVPEDKMPRCWPRSPPRMPGQKLPFGLAPDHRGRPWLRRHHRGHRRGSNLSLDGFRQS